MANNTNFHRKAFDEATLVKLEIFEMYATEWLPVFLCPKEVFCHEVHIYDFFAGPGIDSTGDMGSPLRLLKTVERFLKHPLLKPVKIYVHFFDKTAKKIEDLKLNIGKSNIVLPGVELDIRRMPFEAAFAESAPVLSDKKAAKLLIIDQYGTKHISEQVFAKLTGSPVCDFLFFLSSATLNRFRDVPAISQKITRPEDPNHVHRAAFDYYKNLLPKDKRYYLAPFSIKKESNNIYGLIFGTAKPLGIEKFLSSAWAKDQDNGEANFDIYRDGVHGQTSLFPKQKLDLFKSDLEASIINGTVKNEFQVTHFCYEHGVLRKHAKPVLDKLKELRIIEAPFRIPAEIKWQKDPRLITLIGKADRQG